MDELYGDCLDELTLPKLLKDKPCRFIESKENLLFTEENEDQSRLPFPS